MVDKSVVGRFVVVVDKFVVARCVVSRSVVKQLRAPQKHVNHQPFPADSGIHRNSNLVPGPSKNRLWGPLGPNLVPK